MKRNKKERDQKPKPHRKREVTISTHSFETIYFPIFLLIFFFESLALEE